MAEKEVDLEDLESTLFGLMKGVRPSESFVHTVRDRLGYRPPMEIEYPERGNDPRMVLGGVLVGSLVLMTVARGLYYIFRRG